MDALPIDQFEKKSGRWHERKIDGVDGGFAFDLIAVLGDFEKAVSSWLSPAADGAVLERRDLRPIAEISERIGSDGGAALIIDYGHAETGFGASCSSPDIMPNCSKLPAKPI